MIKRPQILQQVKKAFGYGRVVAILGPRQCGKTTLAKSLIHPHVDTYFDLEDPADNAKLSQPKDALAGLKGVVTIDEIQRRPDIFPILRVLADRKPLPAKFLILGSASPALIKHSSESLAGRLARVEVSGFFCDEVQMKSKDRLWLRGGLPLSYLAASNDKSFAWRKDYIGSLINQEFPLYGISLPPVTIYRYWSMLAHYHGQIFTASEIAKSLGISEQTVKRYLDVLSGLFLVRQLQPWYANISKRQVKSPKIYFRDLGLLHCLLGIRRWEDLLSHPKYGASWEGFVLEEVIHAFEPDEVYHWATHQGAEIDLVFTKGGRMYGVEVKRADAPAMTPSMRIALEDLGLERIAVIYPGNKRYSLHKKIDVLPFEAIMGGMTGIF